MKAQSIYPYKTTKVPFSLGPFGQTGWTVGTFSTAKKAAEFVENSPNASLPCWGRYAIIDGELYTVR